MVGNKGGVNAATIEPGGTVIVDESKIRALNDELKKVAWTRLNWIPGDLEFHGVEIWHAAKYWAGKSPPELLAAYGDAIKILETLDLSVAYSSIHKQRLHDKYNGSADDNAYRLAWQFLVEKLDQISTNKIIIADDKKEEELKAIGMLHYMQQYGWGEVPGKTLLHVNDTLHFVDSSTSPGVQMADLVAYVLQRHVRGKETHPDARHALSDMYTAIRQRTLTWREPWPA